MSKPIVILAAAALAIIAVVAWANPSSLDAAGPAASQTQVDVTGLTKNAGDLPAQQYDAF